MKKQVFRDSYAPKIRRLCSKCRKGGLMITGSCPLFRITHSWQHPRFSFLSAGARSVWSVKEKIKSRVLLSFVVGIVCAYTWLKATLVYQKWYNLHILAGFIMIFSYFLFVLTSTCHKTKLTWNRKKRTGAS